MYGNRLASTGGGVVVLGVATNQWWMVAGAVALVVAGALLVRATRPLRKDRRKASR